MLLLAFNIGTLHYAVAAKQIIEILPLTSINAVPGAPDYVAGILDYRGTPVPIINLCLLTNGQDYNKVLSSRIILVNYTARNRKVYPLGLIAEKVTETVTIPKSDFNPTGVSVKGRTYLGEVTKSNGTMIQYIEINELLTEPVQMMLFNETKNKEQNNYM